MKITKNEIVKTTKEKDCYDITVNITAKELYNLLPIDNNSGGNVVIDTISDMLSKKFNKVYNRNWYDSWAIKNQKDIIKLSFDLEIFKD